LNEARYFLDRPPHLYGAVNKKGMAEIAYHRGVLLWAVGERDRARTVLQSAADLGESGKPFSKRAAAVLEKNQLPGGLVPMPRKPDLSELLSPVVPDRRAR
jgi:hypothetical protein